MAAESFAAIASLTPAAALAPLLFALCVGLLAPGRAASLALAVATALAFCLCAAVGVARLALGLGGALGFAGAVLILALGLAALSLPAPPQSLQQARESRLNPLLAGALLAGCAAAPLLGAGLEGVLALQFAAMAAAALLGVARAPGAADAGLRFLTQAGLGGAFALIGAMLLARPGSEPLAFAALIGGLAMIAGLAPAHLGAHANAAVAAKGPSAMAHHVIQAAGLFLLTFIALAAYSNPVLARAAAYVFSGLAVIGVGAGALQALAARDLRRLVWAGATAQAGLVALALAMGGPGMSGAMMQIVAFSLATAAMSAAIGAIAPGAPAPIEALDGLARRAPILAVALSVALLSFVGAPLTLGFAAKWQVLSAAIAAGWWWAAFLTLAAVLAAAIVAGRLLGRMFASSPAPDAPAPHAAPVFAAAILAAVLVIGAFNSGALALLADAAIAPAAGRAP